MFHFRSDSQQPNKSQTIKIRKIYKQYESIINGGQALRIILQLQRVKSKASKMKKIKGLDTSKKNKDSLTIKEKKNRRRGVYIGQL